MKKIAAAIITLVLMTTLISPAVGQNNFVEELREGEHLNVDLRLGMYNDRATGNQDLVREFDGRDFRLWGIERLNTWGYNGPVQFWLDARDLVTGNESVNIDVNVANSFGASLNTDALTHRLGRPPEVDPYLGGLGIRGVNPETGNPFGGAFVDLAADIPLGLDRRVNNFSARFTPGGAVTVRGDWWQENERGAQQAFSGSTGTALGIDRNTDQGTAGVDIQLGERSVINYSFQRRDFTERQGASLVPGVMLSDVSVPNTKASTNVLRARTQLGDRVFFTGSHTNRSRRSTNAIIPLPGVGHLHDQPGTPLDNRVEIDATNLALTFLVTDTLTLTPRFRRYDLENKVPPVFRMVGPANAQVPDTIPNNFAISRKTESLQLDGSFTGIPQAFIRFGYERRDLDRQLGTLHEDIKIMGEELIRDRNRSNIWRVSARYNPLRQLGLSGNFESTSASNPGFFGEPTDRTRLVFNANYLVSDNFAIFGNHNRLSEENTIIRVPVDEIETPATNPAEMLARRLAAGQGYEHKANNTILGAWYAVNPRLTLDANFARTSTDSSALWILGRSTGGANLPHLEPGVVPMETSDDQFSIGATYMINPRFRTYGRFFNTSSSGRMNIDSNFAQISGAPDLPLGWNPIDIDTRRYTVGFSYNINPGNRLLFDFSVAEWKDKIDPGNNGQFDLWRVAWSSPF